MFKRLATFALAGSTLLAGCGAFGDAMTSHTNVVARAAGNELSVDDAASLIAQNPRLPAQTGVVEAVANLWVDYTLLANAASTDSTLSQVDLSPLVRPEMEQEMVYKLRDKVIKPDTTISDADLEKLYNESQPDVAIHARHILIRVDQGDSQAKKDSARALAESIRKRAVAGEDFAKLAEQYSQDPGTAKKGGDLGFFKRGTMVAPFEEAAFKLQPGQISDVVETPFGFHIIKLEERKVPKFEDNKQQFRAEIIQQRQAAAESTYIAQLTDGRDIKVQNGAYDVARELAKNPQMELSGRAAERALVKYQGGALTASEFQSFMHRLPTPQRAPYGNASDDQLERVLKGLTTQELLVQEAEKEGFQVNKAAEDSVSQEVRSRLVSAVSTLGLDAKPQQGESRAEAVNRRVNALIEAIVRGNAQVLPLGPVAYSLRKQGGAEIYDRTFQDVVSRIEAIRAQQPSDTGAAAPTGAPPSGAPMPTPPTGSAAPGSAAPGDTTGQ